MSPTTREKIIAYLQEHRRASAPELSQALAMTRANMRYHLERLVEEGKIEPEPNAVGASQGRGRPVQVFRLSTGTRPNNLAELAAALLDALLAPLTDQPARTEALRQLARQMAGSSPLHRHLTQRLTRAVLNLNQKQYQARWEARPQGPQVLFRSCPYAAVLPGRPELCQMDALLLEQLLGAPVRQTARMDLDSDRPPACVFLLAPPDKPDPKS